jgi:hypothetical protein
MSQGMYRVRIQKRRQCYRNEQENINQEKLQKDNIMDSYRNKLNKAWTEQVEKEVHLDPEIQGQHIKRHKQRSNLRTRI